MHPARFIVIFLYTAFVTSGNLIKKREIFEDNVHSEFGYDFGHSSSLFFPISATIPQPPLYHSEPFILSKPTLIQKVYAAPTSAEIAAAISAAKEASANVMAAQQRVQAAKEDLLTQQKIANHKESQAAFALQQTEAAAAVQRQQASAAANAVILAQQRLAQAKSGVAEKQRIAADKEAAAADAIQQSAAAAAHEIKKTESTAVKVAAIQNSKATAALKHVTAIKDASVTATSAAVSVANGHAINDGHPWLIPIKVGHFAHWH